MAETKGFLAVGEEVTRGTAESSTVGFIPVNTLPIVKPDYMAVKRGEFRGEDAALGHTLERRMGEKWEGIAPEIPMFSEAGTVAGMIGTILKHFFGKATSAQNASTGQYAHMMYPVNDPYASANLGTKALTLNVNAMHEATLKNHIYAGGRVGKLSLKQEINQPLIVVPDFFGQTMGAIGSGLGSPAFPAENLRFDYNNLTIRNGATVTRTGTGPDFTDLTSSGDIVKPDSITLDFEWGKTDKQVLDGTTSPGVTNVGIITGKLSFVIDFRSPGSGFNSVTEFTTWLNATSTTSFLLTWDSGTQAGTGDNHSFILDLPICNRLGGAPEIKLDGVAPITLEYDFHFDATTTLYAIGLLLKNTATTV